jgi:hypothetical protein
MRLLRSLLPVIASFLSVAAFAQQDQLGTFESSGVPGKRFQAPRDPKAMEIVDQALKTGGSAGAMKEIRDFSATGEITTHGDQQKNGTVTIRWGGPNAFRVDTTLPAGINSASIEKGKWATQSEAGPVKEIHNVQPPITSRSLALPYVSLRLLLGDPRLRFSYEGLTEINGKSSHAIRVRRVLPNRPDIAVKDVSTSDFFIDAETFQIVLTQDYFYPTDIAHTLRYSDYRPLNGLLVPFSIAEEVAGQRTWTIVLGQLQLNTGLADSGFALTK